MFTFRKFCPLLVIALVGGLLFSPTGIASAVPPSNDDIANAAVVTSLPYSFSGDLTDDVLSPDEQVSPCFGGTLAQAVWFTYAADHSGRVAINLAQYGYDLGVAILRKDAGGLTLVGCGNPIGQPASFTAVAGEQYYIELVSWNAISTYTIEIYEPPPPANDNFDQAIEITSLPYGGGIDVLGATTQMAEPAPSCLNGNPLQRTIWFKYMPTWQQTITASIFTYFRSDIALSLYKGSSLDTLQEITSACGSGTNPVTLETGVPVYIQISTMKDIGGRTYLNINGSPKPPDNDAFGAAADVSLAALPVDVPVSNVGATTEPGEPFPSCYAGYPVGKTVWYRFTPQTSKVLIISHSTSNYGNSAFIAIYQGSDLGSLAPLADSCTGQISPVTMEAGQVYYLQLGSINNAEDGAAWLHIEQVPPPPDNDAFTAAADVSLAALPVDVPVSNVSATTEPGEPFPGCYTGNPAGKTVWYRFTPQTSVPVSITYNTGNYGNSPFYAIYQGSDLASLAPVANSCAGQTSFVNMEAGQVYYLQVGSLNNVEDSAAQLHIEQVTSPPANDNIASAEVISLPADVSGSTANATIETADLAALAWTTPNLPVQTVWYTFTALKNDTAHLHLNTNWNWWWPTFMAVYHGGAGRLEPLAYGTGADFTLDVAVTQGEKYFVQVGSNNSNATGVFTLSVQVPPANDNLADAEPISGGLPITRLANAQYATVEPFETSNSTNGFTNTVWYAFTPAETASYTVTANEWYSGVSVWVPDSSGALVEVGWNLNDRSARVFAGKQDTMYFIQLGSKYGYYYGQNSFTLTKTQPPSVRFYVYPYDPSVYDATSFCDGTYDPVGIGVQTRKWSFGDGATAETTDACVTHQYAADNASGYAVTLTVTTLDGRTAVSSQSVVVATHNVVITKFVLPDTVRAGQTRPITVYVANPTPYTENVIVEIYRSTPSGWVKFGELTQQVVPSPLNKPVSFSFSYTFTKEDASIGKVTFKAVARLEYRRDALPDNNTAISLPLRVR